MSVEVVTPDPASWEAQALGGPVTVGPAAVMPSPAVLQAVAVYGGVVPTSSPLGAAPASFAPVAHRGTVVEVNGGETAVVISAWPGPAPFTFVSVNGQTVGVEALAISTPAPAVFSAAATPTRAVQTDGGTTTVVTTSNTPCGCCLVCCLNDWTGPICLCMSGWVGVNYQNGSGVWRYDDYTSFNDCFTLTYNPTYGWWEFNETGNYLGRFIRVTRDCTFFISWFNRQITPGIGWSFRVAPAGTCGDSLELEIIPFNRACGLFYPTGTNPFATCPSGGELNLGGGYITGTVTGGTCEELMLTGARTGKTTQAVRTNRPRARTTLPVARPKECEYVGRRTEFRHGCHGWSCKHACDHPDLEKKGTHPVAVPGGNCQTCPDYEPSS